jgi:hypothetical protein
MTKIKKYWIPLAFVLFIGAGAVTDIATNFTTQQIMNWVFNTADSTLDVNIKGSTGGATAPDTSVIWWNDTTTNVIDTLSRRNWWTLTNLNTKFKSKFVFTITADSILEFSTTFAFIAGTVFKLNAGETYTSNYLDPAKVADIFYRKFSSKPGACNTRGGVQGK